MKWKFLIGLCVLFVSVWPAAGHAGTLENKDLKDYHYEVSWKDKRVSGIIYQEASMSDMCRYGDCELRLIETGQTIQLRPGDHIVIRDGQMERQND